MGNRVVITGLGVVSPNGTDLQSFNHAIKNGISGIRYDPQLEALNFSCQIAAKPELTPERISEYFTPLELRNLDSSGITYGVIAALDAWKDAGLAIEKNEDPDWDSGSIFGMGTSGVDKFRWAAKLLDEGLVRKIGSSVVVQTMASGVVAFIGGKLGLGNQVTVNSSACATGTESLLMCYEHIKAGKAKRMLSGGTADTGPYIWGGFDAMKVCTFKHNHEPEKGSRPMSATASGFVPGGGAAALVLESLDSALARGARIYAEVLGGAVNSGGQRGLGTMTAPNPVAVQKCITQALINTNVDPLEIDVINGHLTATSKDGLEIENWTKALGRSGKDFPYINSLKSMIGHCIGASGSLESVASVLQIDEGFIFPNINCEDLHPEIEKLIDKEKVVTKLIKQPITTLVKASFGFGDVNACIILRKYNDG